MDCWFQGKNTSVYKDWGRFHTYSLFAVVRIRDQIVTMLHIASSLVCVHTTKKCDFDVWVWKWGKAEAGK